MNVQRAVDMDQLNRRYRPALMSFFLRRIHDHAEAEDLTQEVFVRVTASGGASENLDGYIFQAAANLLRDRGRRAKIRNDYRFNFYDYEVGQGDGITPARVLDAKESLRSVVDELQKLPERTRTIFVMYRLEGLKQRDIAEALGISASAVEKHVVKAVAALARARAGGQ